MTFYSNMSARYHTFLPARRCACAVFATATCPYVRLSVIRRYCAEQKQDREMYIIG